MGRTLGNKLENLVPLLLMQLFINIFFDPVSLPLKHTYAWTRLNDTNVTQVPMMFDSVI